MPSLGLAGSQTCPDTSSTCVKKFFTICIVYKIFLGNLANNERNQENKLSLLNYILELGTCGFWFQWLSFSFNAIFQTAGAQPYYV